MRARVADVHPIALSHAAREARSASRAASHDRGVTAGAKPRRRHASRGDPGAIGTIALEISDRLV